MPEVLLGIGGSVLGGAPAAPIAGAWVQLEDNSGKPMTIEATDASGHFRFENLEQGATYTLRVRAPGFAEGTRTFVVPSAAGNYDVQLV